LTGPSHWRSSSRPNKVRCFDFWRIDDVKPYRAAINDTLQKAAEKAAMQNVMLVLENEFACNTTQQLLPQMP
jgi:hypothetical protein